MSVDQKLPESPYIGLVPYTEAEAPFFFGREKESDIIIDNLRASRLTVLYGPSGVGKSSVLNAGVTYKLRKITEEYIKEYGLPQFAVINFRDWSDAPLVRFTQKAHAAVAQALQVEAIEPVSAATLAETLKALNNRYGIEFLIILDQFEENFNPRPAGKNGNDFIAQLPSAVNDASLRAKFLISLRDDSLAKLDRFKTSLPNLLDNRLSLKHMNHEGAREAIEKPICAYNRLLAEDETKYQIEPELVEKILNEIVSSQQAAAQTGQNLNENKPGSARIEAVYLQLVMERLWEKDKEQRVLRASTLDQLKGLENIVQEYLNKALTEKLDEPQQEVAANIFRYLVTPSGIKISYTRSDLLKEVEADEEALDSVLKSLNESRILKTTDSPLDQPNEIRYEIFHDKLAEAVLKWRSAYEQRMNLFAAEQKRIEEAHQLAREAQNNFLRWLLMLTSVGIIIFMALAIVAFYQYKAADKARDEAEASLDEANNEKEKLAKYIQSFQLTLKTIREEPKQEYREELIKRASEESLKALEPEESKLTVKQEQQIEAVQEKQLGSGRNIRATGLKLWENGRTLHIRFLDGNSDIQEKVKQIAPEWTKYANLKFAFDSSPDAEIRISFKFPGSYSYIGTDALAVPQNQPTMELGALNKLEGENFRRVVLHEFGHLLGLIHETQQPNADIPWNEEAVYEFYSKPPYNWSRNVIDANIFPDRRKSYSFYRKFDRDSVMMYFLIPKEHLEGDSFPPVTKLSTSLSESDKTFAGQLYPFQVGTKN